MYIYKVGELFQEGVTKYQEGTKFNFDVGGASLMFFFSRPMFHEINSIQNGEITAAMYMKDEIIFMLYKFQGMEWIDTSFNLNLSENFGICPVSEGMGYANSIYLIDARTGIIKVMRTIGWSEKFSRKFHELVWKQKGMPFDRDTYFKKIDSIYKNYDTKILVARCDIISKLVDGRNK